MLIRGRPSERTTLFVRVDTDNIAASAECFWRNPRDQSRALRPLCSVASGLVLVWLLALAPSLLADPPAPEGYRARRPWIGPVGVRERTADIMARQAHQVGRPTPYRVHVRTTVELTEYDDGAARPASATPAAPVPATAGSAQTVGLNFLGATLADTRAFPPDSMGAVGPAQYIVAVNGRVRSFNKNTGAADGVLDVDTDVFFASVMTPPVTNNFTSDPRIRYDRLSGRWFIIMIDVPGQLGNQPDRIMIAVSDGPTITPSAPWTFFYFRHDLASPAGDSNEFADYPTLGIDAHALYIGVNVFATRGQGSFDNTSAFVVRKSSLLVTNNAPTNIVVTAFRDLVPNGQAGGPYTPQGVDNYNPNATEGYVIGVTATHVFFILNKLTLIRISDPGGTPAISSTVTFTIPTSGGTITVPHLGNTNGTAGYLDGLDFRLMAAHVRNGRLWTSQNLAVDNTGSPGGTDTRMGVRWYELTGIPTGQTPSVFQSGTVFQPSSGNTTDQRCYWMGSVMVSGQGHAAMGFSVAGANEHVNAGAAGRLANDALGTMRTPVLYTASSTPYNAHDHKGNLVTRWGDYSYTCLDPSDDMTLWTIQEYCNATDSYGVQIAKLLAPPPATPTNCSPASLAAGAANVSVVVTGMSDGDTGFFDPGTGFSNRLSAAISGGGVTINSLTYSNPTHLTLNLSVSASATSGTRTITVTNPDGQSATSASGLLTITGGNTNGPPSLAAIANKTVNELATLTFTNTATDPNGDVLTYSLDPGAPSGTSINPTNGVFTWTPNEAQGPGLYTNTVRVTDNGSPLLSDSKTFPITVNEVNSAPVLATISNKTVNEGTLLTFTNSASDPDLPANTFTYSLDPGAPAGATVNSSSGVFTWTPNESQGPGTYTNTIRVTDSGSPPLSDKKTFAVVVNEVNSAPALTVPANQTIDELTTLSVSASATDPDLPTNTLTFSLVSPPSGLTINPANGAISWTPDEAQGPSTNTITVRVTDNGSPPRSDTNSFTVVVTEVNSAPVLAAIADRTIHQGTTLMITNTATDPDIPNNSLTFSLDTNAPAGAAVGSTSGVFNWTPAEAFVDTTNNITVQVTDNGSPHLSDSKSFAVTVVSRPVLQSIVLSNDVVTITWSAIAGQIYRVQFNEDLSATAWTDLPPDVMATGSVASKSDTVDSAIQRFYRVRPLP